MTDQPMTDWEIVRAMHTYGGHFAKALAAACHRADPPNLARIKTAFPELWTEYAQFARARKEATEQ